MENKKFGVQIISFENIDYLESIIRMFQPFVYKIVVSTSKKSWNGGMKNNGAVKKTVLPLVEEFNNVNLVEGDWKTETEQRNANLRHMAECDYVFIVDDDEMWSSGDIHNIKEFVQQHSGYTIFRAIWNTRFKNIKWRVNPRENFRPVVLIKKGISFANNREIEMSPNAATILIPEDVVLVEHFSYLRTDEGKIKDKIKSFSHANEIVGGADLWYENVYLQADLDSKNLHPTNPPCYAGLIQDDIHPEIRKFLKEYSYVSIK